MPLLQLLHIMCPGTGLPLVWAPSASRSWQNVFASLHVCGGRLCAKTGQLTRAAYRTCARPPPYGGLLCCRRLSALHIRPVPSPLHPSIRRTHVAATAQLAGQHTPVVGQLMVMLTNNRDQLCHPAASQAVSAARKLGGPAMLGDAPETQSQAPRASALHRTQTPPGTLKAGMAQHKGRKQSRIILARSVLGT